MSGLSILCEVLEPPRVEIGKNKERVRLAVRLKHKTAPRDKFWWSGDVAAAMVSSEALAKMAVGNTVTVELGGWAAFWLARSPDPAAFEGALKAALKAVPEAAAKAAANAAANAAAKAAANAAANAAAKAAANAALDAALKDAFESEFKADTGVSGAALVVGSPSGGQWIIAGGSLAERQ